MGLFDKLFGKKSDQENDAPIEMDGSAVSEDMDVTLHEVGYHQLHGAPYRQKEIAKAPDGMFEVRICKAPKGAFYKYSAKFGNIEVGYFMDEGSLAKTGHKPGDTVKARKVHQAGSSKAPYTIEVFD